MGWLIPKTYLAWREPRTVRRRRESLAEASQSRMVRPLLVLLIAGLLLLMWLLATLNPNNHPPRFQMVLPIAFGGGVIYVYLLPLLYKLFPSQIKLNR